MVKFLLRDGIITAIQLQQGKDQECFIRVPFRNQHFKIVLLIHTTHVAETDMLQKANKEELS